MEPLFIQPEVELEKTAGEVDLPEDPNQWPQEVLQELFKQVPYIADFQPHVTMQRVDSERGYGLGQVEISNKSEAQLGTDQEMLDAAGVRSVRIPVVIKGHKLSPFDLLINDVSKVLPLTESRLRQSLFRPQLFDVTSQTPGDQSMIGQLYPPYRQNYGFGGGGVAMTAGMGKQSSVLEEYLIKELESKDPGFRRPDLKKEAESLGGRGRGTPGSGEGCGQPGRRRGQKGEVSRKLRFRKTASLISATFSSYNRSDIDHFFSKLSSDVQLQAAYEKNAEATMGPIGILASHDPVSLEKRAQVLAERIKPTVVQLLKDGDGYLMKTASHLYWNPQTVRLTRWELVQNFGEKVALAADEAGQVTMAEGAEAPQEEAPLNQEEPITVNESGLYKVVDEEGGKELIGFVIPNLLDVDGTPLPLSLFTNGSHSAVQPDILGTPAGDGGNLPTGQPGGAGAFFSHTDGGVLQATIPLELSGGSYASPNEPATLVGNTFDGRAVEVSVQPNIQTILQSPEGKMLVPQHWQWTPLGSAGAVSLATAEDSNGAEAPEDWHEAAPEAIPEDLESNEPEQKESHVWIRGDHDSFTFSGPAVEKLASDETRMVSVDDAMFLLAGLGVEQGQGVKKLAQSMRAPQKVRTGRGIKTASSQDAWARGQAQKWGHIVPMLRKDLMKEAALIPDPTAVDTVLSLGFINPENIMTFVSYLPTLEDSQAKMCDLLLAARVGLTDVSSTALERAIRSTEEAVEGLKVLAFQG